MKTWLPGLLMCCSLAGFGQAGDADQSSRPLLREFIGINGHYHFKPGLYRPVTRLVRNYHDMNWDVKAPGDRPTFPKCANGVNWNKVYGPWHAEGFEISICAQFQHFGASHTNLTGLWHGHESWARTYGYEMARAFGPTHGTGVATSIEIDNEPGSGFDDALYQRLFRQMAQGIRAADPAVKIVSCTVHDAAADKYHKSVGETFGDARLHPLLDVLNVHTYAVLPEGVRAHPWDRTFPEDPRSPFLKKVDDVIAWRDRHCPGKKVWVTEMGWDACTPGAMRKRTGWFKKLGWTGVSELAQAQYLVRAFLLLSARDVARTYLYFYNDNDAASTHAASGITRRFQPKPSYWALRQLQTVLGDYRFSRIVHESGGNHVYAYRSDDGAEIWVVWRSASGPATMRTRAGSPLAGATGIQSMALTDADFAFVPVPATINLTGSVQFIRFEHSGGE